MLDTNEDVEFSTVIKMRAPEAMRNAVKRAASLRMTTGSEYVRQAIVDRLQRDGVDPGRYPADAA